MRTNNTKSAGEITRFGVAVDGLRRARIAATMAFRS